MALRSSHQTGPEQKILFPVERPIHYYRKISAVNFRIQLIGGQLKQVVHKNRLKLCRTDPPGAIDQKQLVDPLTSQEGNAGFVTVGTDVDHRDHDVLEDPNVGEEEVIAGVDDDQDGTENAREGPARRYPNRGRRQPDRYQTGFS